MRKAIVAVLCLGGLFASFAGADTLTTKDGKTYEGEVVERTARVIVFRIHMFGSTFTKRFDAEDVISIKEGEIREEAEPETPETEAKPELRKEYPPEPEAPPVVTYEGPTYYRVPFKGVVGEDVTAKFLTRCFEDAKERNPTVVLLVVDSPGGLVDEVQPIAELLQKVQKEMHVVVWVKDALSAAAISSLAVKEIYMRPSATLGAATAYSITGSGSAEVDEKFTSVWRAQARSIAESGGYDGLLAEAMIDATVSLFYMEKNGEIIFRRQGNRQYTLLSPKGRILTLTASDALKCKLSRGTAETVEELGEIMGQEGWAECEGHAMMLLKYQEEVSADFEKVKDEIKGKYDEQIERMEKNFPWRFDDYEVYQNGPRRGWFTPRSQGLWKRRTGVCIASLVKAEDVIEEMAELTGKVPPLEKYEGFEEWLNEHQEDIRKFRLKLYRNQNVRGPFEINMED